MYSDRRTNQSGSVVVFLIVSTLLAAAVIGGIYAVQKRGASAEPAEVQVAQNTQTQTDQDKAEQAQRDKEAQEKANEDAKQQQSTTDEAKPMPQTSTAPQVAAPLPQTGPSDWLTQALTVGVLVAAIGIYLKSYRHRFGSLLR